MLVNALLLHGSYLLTERVYKKVYKKFGTETVLS